MRDRTTRRAAGTLELAEIEPSIPGETHNLHGAYVVDVTTRVVTIEYDPKEPRWKPWRIEVDRTTGFPIKGCDSAWRVADADVPRLKDLVAPAGSQTKRKTREGD